MLIRLPYKFRDVHRRFGGRAFSMLDVGAGNHSATLARRWFPLVHYTGLDRERGYHNADADFAVMNAFIEMDLTKLDFAALPEAGYDVILIAHVVEHLENAPDVLRGLVPKLRPGGLMYVETPGRRSLTLPSMRGTLNFHDDPTHVRLYPHDELAEILRGAGMRIDRAGTRRDLQGALLTPLLALNALRLHGYVPGGVFWDLLGFADVVVATRS